MNKIIEEAPKYRVEFKVSQQKPLTMVCVARTMKEVRQILRVFKSPSVAWCYHFKLFNNLTGELIRDLDKTKSK